MYKLSSKTQELVNRVDTRDLWENIKRSKKMLSQRYFTGLCIQVLTLSITPVAIYFTMHDPLLALNVATAIGVYGVIATSIGVYKLIQVRTS